MDYKVEENLMNAVLAVFQHVPTHIGSDVYQALKQTINSQNQEHFQAEHEKRVDAAIAERSRKENPDKPSGGVAGPSPDYSHKKVPVVPSNLEVTSEENPL